MNAKRIVLGGLAAGLKALRSRRYRHVLAIASLAACTGPGCGSSNGVPSHDASSGGTDASGSAATPDGSTEASSSSGNDSGDGSGGDASSGDSSGDKSDGGSSDIQKPGPSAQLFNNPYYQCLRNFYVSNDGASPGTAWATIANADTSDRKGGDCINALPGTYARFNSNMTHGGTTASSSGYVAYRCTTPAFISGAGCVVTDTGDAVRAGMYTSSSAYPS